MVADIVEATAALHNPETGSLCAAVFVDEHLLFTAAHCVRGLDVGGVVQIKPHSSDLAEGKVVEVLPDSDLAAVLVETVGAHGVAPLGSLPVRGQHVLVVGHPLGMDFSFSSGDVAAVRKMQDVLEDEDISPDTLVIQTTAPISPGNSGGGMFDESGRLLGIASFTMRRGSNLGFFVAVVR